MADYDDWLRAQKAKQLESPDDADIRQDDAYESKHRDVRYRDGKRTDKIPIWRITAGSWAQLIIAGLFWMSMVLALQSHGPQNGEAKGWLSVLAFIPALILSFVFWRAIGQGWRDRARWFVRLSPLLLLGLGMLNVAHRRSGSPASASSAKAQTALAAPVVAPPAPPALDTVRAWVERNQVCRRETRSLRRIPSQEGRLASTLECAHEVPPAALVAAAEKAPLDARVRGAVAAVGLAAATPERIDWILAQLDENEGPYGETALDAATRLALRSPEIAREKLRAARPSGPTGAMLQAVLRARIGVDVEPSCAKLAQVATSTSFELARAASDHLGRLGVGCRSVRPLLFALVAEQRRLPTGNMVAASLVRIIGELGLDGYGELLEVSMTVSDKDPLLSRAVQESLRAMLDRDYEGQVGLSPFVANHPGNKDLVGEMVIETGPCTFRQLAVPRAAYKRWPDRPICVVGVKNRPKLLEPIAW